jgi:hypothetical protein
MISTVNEAINRKLTSISFTDIIIGTVISLEPLQIRINNRITIGLSFIEPMSLGIDDNSPSSALPLTVGEKVQMIRYSNGQRFYILGKSTNASTINYNELQNKPKLNTANSTSLAVNESEELKGIISLHKVAKTGSYNDLVDKPAPYWPIGSIYISVVNTNPSQWFDGVWESFGSGRVLVGVDASQSEFNTVMKTGGEKTHKLTTNEMPSHSHDITTFRGSTQWALGYIWARAATDSDPNNQTWVTNTNNAGGDQPHNNLQPYITVYMWRRVS